MRSSFLLSLLLCFTMSTQAQTDKQTRAGIQKCESEKERISGIATHSFSYIWKNEYGETVEMTFYTHVFDSLNAKSIVMVSVLPLERPAPWTMHYYLNEKGRVVLIENASMDTEMLVEQFQTSYHMPDEATVIKQDLRWDKKAKKLKEESVEANHTWSEEDAIPLFTTAADFMGHLQHCVPHEWYVYADEAFKRDTTTGLVTGSETPLKVNKSNGKISMVFKRDRTVICEDDEKAEQTIVHGMIGEQSGYRNELYLYSTVLGFYDDLLLVQNGTGVANSWQLEIYYVGEASPRMTLSVADVMIGMDAVYVVQQLDPEKTSLTCPDEDGMSYQPFGYYRIALEDLKGLIPAEAHFTGQTECRYAE